jgi:thioredoxin 2
VPFIRACKSCGRRNRVPASHLTHTGRCGACHKPLPAIDEPIEVDGQLFDEIIGSTSVPVLVDFWAEWCAPCKMAAPEVARVASAQAGQALVLKVDTDAHPELAARFNVRGIPNFAVFLGGRMVMQQAGVVGHDTMEQWLKSAKPLATA